MYLRADQVLGQALPDQLRHGRGHRHRAGVPVRDELERLLAASSVTSSAPRWPSRGCSRSSWSRRSSACGSSAGTSCPRGCTWPRIWLVAHRHDPVGVLHPRRQLVDAAPGRLPVNPDTGRAELTDFWAVLTQNTTLVTASAHADRRVRDRRRLRGRRSPPGTWPRKRHARRAAGRRCGCGLVVTLVASAARRGHRRHAGQDHDRAAADEDGRRRGAVRDDQQPRAVLDLHRSATLDGQQGDLLDPRSRACSPSWPPARFDGEVRGHQQHPGRSTSRQYGPGDYRPNIPVTYWALPLMIGLRAASLLPGRRRSGCG